VKKQSSTKPEVPK